MKVNLRWIPLSLCFHIVMRAQNESHTKSEPCQMITYQLWLISATKCFLSELQKIAKLLSSCSKSAANDTEPISEPADKSSTAEFESEPQVSVTGPQVTYQTFQASKVEMNKSFLDATESRSDTQTRGDETPRVAVNPPEVQRKVVEHTVRSEASVSQTNVSFRLRGFSGKLPALIMRLTSTHGEIVLSSFCRT